jgi:probable HAF family extracellular repeat protein
MRRLSFVVLSAVLVGCSDDSQFIPAVAPLAAVSPNAEYHIEKRPVAGPGTAQGGAINNQAWVSGYSGQPNGKRHATLWRDGVIQDLGAIGGADANSSVQWPGLNNNGVVVGISQTATPDPLSESWSCAAFIAPTGNTCLGFVWEDGVMTPLPTLGGSNGFAAGVNSRGQIVGWAETAVHDPTCNLPQVLQFRAVLWEPTTRAVQELHPLDGDSTSAATAINERGQVVGISGDCDVAVGRFSARHAVMWDHGTPIELPNLGGIGWHTPMAINERGDVVGFSNPPDGDLDADSVRAFHWTRQDGIKDLGKIPGDDFSQALSINARGQIVGVSCGAVCRAVLWQDGKLTILKSLAGPGFSDDLWSARSINDAGQITGRLLDSATGTFVPYVASPVPGKP